MELNNIPVNPGVMAASFRDKGVRSSRVLIGWRCTKNIDALKVHKTSVRQNHNIVQLYDHISIV